MPITAELVSDPFSAGATDEPGPRWYSNYFNVRLASTDFGKKREEHYRICNQILLEQLKKDESAEIQFCPDISNKDLMELIDRNTANGKHSLSPYFVWEHCSSTTAHGVLGVMRLLPKSQHTPGSAYWRLIHPEYKNTGGYHEWAIPAGAPAQSNIRTPKRMTITTISTLTADKLPLYFHKAVDTNNYECFQHLLKRAKELQISPERLEAIFTEKYEAKGIKRPTTLLHRAATNACRDIVNAVLVYGGCTREQLHCLDSSGNSAVHVAAKRNRLFVLKKFMHLGADITIRSKAGQTVRDIAAEHAILEEKYRVICSRIHKTSHSTSKPSDSAAEDEKQAKPLSATARMVRDPTFVYDGLARKQSALSEVRRSTSTTQVTTAAPTIRQAVSAPSATAGSFKGSTAKLTAPQSTTLKASVTDAVSLREVSKPQQASQKAYTPFWGDKKIQSANQSAGKPQTPQQSQPRAQQYTQQAAQQQIQHRAQTQPQQYSVNQQPRRAQPLVNPHIVQQRIQRRVQPQMSQNRIIQQLQRRAPQHQAQQQAQQAAQRAATAAAQRAATAAAQRAATAAAQRAAAAAAQRAATAAAAQRAAAAAAQRAAATAAQRAATAAATQRAATAAAQRAATAAAQRAATAAAQRATAAATQRAAAAQRSSYRR